MSESVSIVTPAGEPARAARPRGISVFGYRLGPETMIAMLIGIASLWANSRYVTHEEFDGFKTKYWEAQREQNRTLNDIRVDIGKISTSQAGLEKSADEIKADVRDLRKTPTHP